MILENEVKLDFKDVLIKPKRSNLNSRSDVNLEREFTFKHSSFKWNGVPIMVSTQATRDAAHMFSPPRADQVANGDALIRAADVAMSMCALEEENDKRLVQFQKYRDGELSRDMTVMQWDVNCGNIEELPDYEWENF